MISVTTGTDVYGAVRKVSQTPIVTKFAMLQFLPVFPIESYYLSRLGPQSRTGVPLILGQTSQSIVGLRLARVDKLSALISYVRAIGAAIVVVSSIGLILGVVGSLTGPRNQADPVQRNLLPVSILALASGCCIALPTYYFTYVVPKRDKMIRQHCGDVLGIAADPARVDADTANVLLDLTLDALAQSGITEPNQAIRDPAQTSDDQKRLLMVFARAMIGVNGRRDEFETLADSLLLELAGPPTVPG